MAKPGEIFHHPTAFTLKFKYGRYTILIFADPLMPFTTLIAELLEILRERYPKGLETSISPELVQIPDSVEDVRLGVPKDVYDLSKGWEEISIDSEGIEECPKGLGLKDGGNVAFTFVSGSGKSRIGDDLFYVEIPNEAELYPEDE